MQKIGLQNISPLLFVAIRFLVGSTILTIIFFKRIRSIDKGTLQKGAILGTLLCLGFGAQTIGLNYTTASKSGFITGMLVVFTPLMQIIIERKVPSIGNFLGVGLVTLGLYFLTSPKGAEFNFGDGLTLVCALLFAIYIVYLDVVSKETDIFHLTYLQILTTGVLSLVMAILFENVRIVPTPNLLLSFAYLTVFATLLTTYVQTRYQRDTTPTRAAIIFSLEPVVSAVLAYVILGEVIGSLGVVGGGFIVTGLLISELSDEIPLLNLRMMELPKKDDGESASP